jgi:excisionase family DNA binding protein
MSNRSQRRHPDHSDLMGLPEAAAYCHISYRTLRRWIAEGRLDAVRVGPRLLFVKAADLDKLITPAGGGAK